MNLLIEHPLSRNGLCLYFLMACLAAADARALEVNEDGSALILEARQAYQSDMENRPVITDPSITDYAALIVKRLVPGDRSLPKGVNLSVTVLESPQPEQSLVRLSIVTHILNADLLAPVTHEAGGDKKLLPPPHGEMSHISRRAEGATMPSITFAKFATTIFRPVSSYSS